MKCKSYLDYTYIRGGMNLSDLSQYEKATESGVIDLVALIVMVAGYAAGKKFSEYMKKRIKANSLEEKARIDEEHRRKAQMDREAEASFQRLCGKLGISPSKDPSVFRGDREKVGIFIQQETIKFINGLIKSPEFKSKYGEYSKFYTPKIDEEISEFGVEIGDQAFYSIEEYFYKKGLSNSPGEELAKDGYFEILGLGEEFVSTTFCNALEFYNIYVGTGDGDESLIYIGNY